jgi:hypothetical protein
MIELLKQVGLPRLLRLGVAGAIPPLWLEIAVLHFRGSFQSKFMWVPVASLPVVFAGGTASSLLRDEGRSRALFRPLALLMTVVGAVGTLFHLRGVARQMGGLYNWKYNVVTGPPLPAPPQVMLLGMLGVAASNPPARGETTYLLGWVRAVDALSYLLLATESGYSHWVGGYFNRVMFTPVVLSPTLALVHMGAAANIKIARKAEGPLSGVAAVAGLVGFGFHIWNISRRSGGFSWQNLNWQNLNWQSFFYGPPVMAPLQLSGQGILGLLAAFFGAGRK